MKAACCLRALRRRICVASVVAESSNGTLMGAKVSTWQATCQSPGARVRCFADYCRWQVQSAFALTCTTDLCSLPRCARRKCNRRAHPDFTFEHGLTQGTMRAYRTTNSDSDEITYFKMLRSIVLDYADDPVEAPALRCYCSTRCSLLAADEYDQCVRCCTLEEMDSYAAPSRNDCPSSAKNSSAPPLQETRKLHGA